MDLGCPLLRGSFVRRLRRRAATLPLLLERTFPGSTFFSAFVEVMAAVRGLRGRKSILLGSSLEWNVLSSVVVCVVSQLLNVLTFMGGVEMGDGSDGSGDWGLYPSLLSPSVWSTTAMVARTLNGLGGRIKSFKLGGTIGSCRPKTIRH